MEYKRGIYTLFCLHNRRHLSRLTVTSNNKKMISHEVNFVELFLIFLMRTSPVTPYLFEHDKKIQLVHSD